MARRGWRALTAGILLVLFLSPCAFPLASALSTQPRRCCCRGKCSCCRRNPTGAAWTGSESCPARCGVSMFPAAGPAAVLPSASRSTRGMRSGTRSGPPRLRRPVHRLPRLSLSASPARFGLSLAPSPSRLGPLPSRGSRPLLDRTEIEICNLSWLYLFSSYLHSRSPPRTPCTASCTIHNIARSREPR